MILCGGDALIDFVPVTAPDGGEAFAHRVGGAVLNAATALARLGQDVAFLGGVSTDLFGDMLVAHMEREGMDVSHATRRADDSTLAFVTLQGGEARYAFYDQTSAGRRWAGAADVPDAEALHIGSVTLIAEPSAAAYEALAAAVCERMVVSLDPNCRPGLIADKAPYAARIARIAACSHIVRLSDEDFAYLHGEADDSEIAHAMLAGRTRLVLISRGEAGASAYFGDERVDVAAARVALKDSIGAGDTFHAGVLAALARDGLLSIAGLERLDRASVEQALVLATQAAALNCEAVGCDPPRLEAVLARLGG